MICVHRRTKKKNSEFQMGIEPTTFRTLEEIVLNQLTRLLHNSFLASKIAFLLNNSL